MPQRQEFSSRRSISCYTSWSDHLLVHLLAFFDFLPKCLMFLQILCSTRLDTPCLQQSRKKKTCYDWLFFEKCISRRVRRRFHEANIVGVPCKQTNSLPPLHQSQNNRNVGTCSAKSLTGFKLYTTSANKCQHCCGSMQMAAKQVTTLLGPTVLGVVGQQCCVRLHGA